MFILLYHVLNLSQDPSNFSGALMLIFLMDPSAKGRRFLTRLDTNTSIRLLSCRLIWTGLSGWNGSSGLYDESLELLESLE